ERGAAGSRQRGLRRVRPRSPALPRPVPGRDRRGSGRREPGLDRRPRSRGLGPTLAGLLRVALRVLPLRRVLLLVVIVTLRLPHEAPGLVLDRVGELAGVDDGA